jgi:hypothetical protein
MAKNLEKILEKLSPERREKIEQRGRELIVEQKTFEDLRTARKLTKEQIGEQLNIRQDKVNYLEKQTDLLLATLRESIESMGGEMYIIVEFPDRSPVTITRFSEEDPDI